MKYSVEAVDQHFDTYRKGSAYDDLMRQYTFRTFEPFLKLNQVMIEFGCSDGQMTERISRYAASLDVVDGSARFIEAARARDLKNTFFHHTLFEAFVPNKAYDAVFSTFVLTHIPDLSAFFGIVKRCLKPGGLFFIAVPNSRVLSRQLARHMGLLEDLYLLSENDRNHGHCRAYDRVRLNRDLESNGFESVAQGGIILKPLADFQMDQLINLGVLKTEQFEGLYKLGLEYPDLSGALYSICRIKKA